MPDSQVKDMTELTSPSADDVLYVQANPTGTPVDRKITIASLRGGISSDTTLYVATYGNDTTGQGTSGSPWATIPKALDYLKDKWINDDVTVTIQLTYGTFTYTSPIVIDHPCGSRILIRGADKNVNIATDIDTGYSPDTFSITTQNALPNTYSRGVLIRPYSASGTNPLMTAGFWRAASNINLYSIDVYHTLKSDVLSHPQNATADITVLSTMLQFNGCNGIVVEAGKSINLENLCINGDSTSNTVGVFAGNHNPSTTGAGVYYTIPGGTIKCAYGSVGVNDFSVGFCAAGGGSINADGCGASNCGYGIWAYQGSVSALSGVFSGCTLDGLHATHGGSIYANYSYAVGNAGCGYKAVYSSSLSAAYGHTIYNLLHGIYAEHNSSIYASYSAVSNNINYGVYSRYSSFIEVQYTTSNSNSVGYFAYNCSSINAYSSNASGNYEGFYASDSSSIMCGGSNSINNTSNGFYSNASSSINCNYALSSGNTYGFQCKNGSYMTAYSGVANSCAYGFYAENGSSVTATLAISNNNTQYGFYASLGSEFFCDFSVARYNGQAGYYCSTNSAVYAPNSNANNNTYYGFYANEAGIIYCTNSIANNCAIYGFAAFSLSQIVCTNSSATGCSVGFACGGTSYMLAATTTGSGNSGADYYIDMNSVAYVNSYVGSPAIYPAVNTYGNNYSIAYT